MNLRLLDILPNLLLPLPVRSSKPRVPLPNHLLKVRHLLSIRKARHELRLAQRDFVALVHLPEVVDLAVQLDHVLHLGGLGLLPRGLGHEGGRLGHDEHARLDLEDVAVPELALLGVERGVQFWRDHVLDADEPGAWVGAVVEYALTDIWLRNRR